MGSLLAALASYLQARTQNGRWLLRIDDLDRPRCIKGAEATIRHQLEAHGLLWDEPARYQSRHIDEYEAALSALKNVEQIYSCSCTRAQLAVRSWPGPDGPVYDGHCRALSLDEQHRALRLHVNADALSFIDGWQGPQQRRMREEVGDFVLQRADGIFAYQLACAVDEGLQGITEVVRGADLLGSTFQQIHLQQRLRLASPQYRHLPVVTDMQGRKLSKQNHARAIDTSRAGANLLQCLRWLNQNPPSGHENAGIQTILDWAIAHWSPLRVSNRQSVVVE